MSKLKYYDGTKWNEVGTTIATLSPTGSIVQFAGSTAPTGWLVCEGQAISRTTYADLFAVIGTTYGAGDGSTTFNLPNLKGKVPVGYDSTQTEFNTMGKTGGAKTHTLTIEQMPNHAHNVKIDRQSGGANGLGFEWVYSTSSDVKSYDGPTFMDKVGGGQAHNILQPYITLKYIIKA